MKLLFPTYAGVYLVLALGVIVSEKELSMRVID